MAYVEGAPTFGARLRRLRREAGLTQSQLAADRLSESYISLIESGRRRPTMDAIRFLAERLGCTPEDLTGEEGAPDPAQIEFALRRAEWETTSGHPDVAAGRFVEARVSAEHLRMPVLVARATAGLAKALEAQGQLTEALAEWQRLQAEAEADPRHGWHVAAVVGACRCAREAGDLDYAVEVGEQFWKRFAGRESTPASTEDLVVAGATLLGAYLELGNLRRARDLANDLTCLADDAATPKAVGAAYWNAALTAEAEGHVGEALRLAERAVQSFAQTDDVRNRARLQTALGGLHLRTEPPDVSEALRLLQAADPVLAQFAGIVDLAYCRTEIARAHLLMDEPTRAAALARETLADLEAAGGGYLQRAKALMVLSAALSTLDQTEEGRVAAEQAVTALETAGATRQAAAAWTELAEICASLDQAGSAIAAYRRATELLGVRTQPLGRDRSEAGQPSQAARAG